MAALCWSCGDGRIITDPANGNRVCESCDADGRPIGTLIYSDDYTYRHRKIRDAKTLISDLTSRLGLSASRAEEASAMVHDVTDGDLGAGEWFPVLVGACSYLVMRRHRLPLPLAEVSDAVGHDVYALGRMASRVIGHLSLEPLPEFDAAQVLERAVNCCPSFSGLGKEKAEEVIRQGRFLLHCAKKWFLSTGRHPLPLVTAIVVFIAEVNGITVAIEDVAKEIYAGVDTSKLRLKELRETLVQAARVLLPWGADVTVQNLSHFAPTLIRFMEIKSKSKSKLESRDEGDGFAFDPNDFLDAYAKRDEEEDSVYYKDVVSGVDWEQLGSIKLSKAAHSRTYKYLLPRLAQIKERGELGKHPQKKRKQGGLEFSALPPSFVAGVEARKSRRLRIEAAKLRVSEIMKCSSPGDLTLSTKEISSAAESSASKKRSKRVSGEYGDDLHVNMIDSLAKKVSRKQKIRGAVENDIDWEDCLIELLLLHGVDENEIEQGQYRRLLDLHLFSARAL